MKYFELFSLLKQKVNFEEDFIPVDEKLEVHNLTFQSINSGILPGEKEHKCEQHSFTAKAAFHQNNTEMVQSPALDVHDAHVQDNIKFRYHIFKPAGEGRSRSVILLFHGFNEKNWHKYYPWAYRLMEQTGKTVVLFPIAFHMNRAPREWSDRYLMSDVSNARRKYYPEIIGSSLVNAAISTRLHIKPQRFIWSGLQSYYDVIQLVEEIRLGKHPLILPEAQFDIFAYSIGGLLAKTLLMTNKDNSFENSRLCLFCSGSVFSRLTPVCKFIMDSETEQALYRYIVGYMEMHLKTDAWLGHFLSSEHPEGWNFLSLLNYNKLSEHRERMLKCLHERIYAVALEKDTVIPSYEILNTLKGRLRDIPICVDIEDFSYDYRHEEPFPLKEQIEDKVSESFERVFSKLAGFLS
ncbi:MAG: DUF6051 family protein [Syntrophomonadaceae bacterium]